MDTGVCVCVCVCVCLCVCVSLEHVCSYLLYGAERGSLAVEVEAAVCQAEGGQVVQSQVLRQQHTLHQVRLLTLT